MKTLFIYFMLVLSVPVFSQITTENRLEIDLKDDFTDETVFEFGKDGFVLFAQSEDKVENEYQWKYQWYSNTLEEKEVQLIPLDATLKYKGAYGNDDFLFQVFRSSKKCSVLKLDARNMNVVVADFELESKGYSDKFYVLGDYIYMTAVKSGKPLLTVLNFTTGKIINHDLEIDGFNPKKIQIENIQVLKKSNELFIFLQAFISRKQSKTFVLRMDDQGNKRDLYDFSSNFTQIITDATASFISDGKYVITGTYSSNNSTSSEGMYFSIVNNGAIELIKFYNFLDLDNFTNYLSEKAQNKIEAKKKRKEKKGKEYNLQYLLAPHNVILVDDGYIYLAEAYYPTYRTEYYTTTTVVNGVSSTVTRSSTVFDGYQYTHAFLAKFNKDGQKQWDQSFPMQLTYKTYSVKRFINIADNQQNSIKLVFSNGKNIYSKKFSFDGEVLQDKESSELETEISGDKTKRSYSSMRYWYDDYFLAYGTQVIKNTENSKVDRKRKVFFVNKLKYE